MANKKFKDLVVAESGLRLPAETAQRALTVDASGDISSSAVTETELGYLSGVTSAVQTQLNGKALASDLSDHISDASDAHDASAISSVPAGNLAASNVQAALDELQSDIDSRALASGLSDHLSDASDAHDASAISSVASGNLAATDVQSALNELQSDIDSRALSSALTDHINDASDAHDASAISSVAAGNLAATDVQSALNELQSDIDSRALDSAVIKKDGSVAFTADQSMGGFKLTNLAAPSGANDAARKSYVDSVAEGLKPKQAVRAATTANIVIATALNSGDVIDGVTLANGDRVLVKNQSAPEENGIYVAGVTPARASDFDSLSPIDEINGAYTFVQEGTVNAGRGYVQAGAVAVLDTDPISFVFFNSSASLTGGDGITITGNDVSVDHDGQGLQFSGAQLSIELDGSTLAKSASGIKLSDTAVTPASLGSATETVSFTVDQQGRLTAASEQNIAIPASQVTDFNEAAQDAVGGALVDSSSIDFTYNDGANTITAVVLPAGVDHDSLQNFAANEHIDHSAVNINTAANSGLSGGGDITASRSLVIDPNNASLVTAALGDQILIADASDSNALKKVTVQTIVNLAGAGSPGDIAETSFSIANNQASPANVTGLAFANATVRGFEVLATVEIDATADLFETFALYGIQKGASWDMSQESVGDSSGIIFSINSSGQIQYISQSYAGFVSGAVKFRARTTSI